MGIECFWFSVILIKRLEENDSDVKFVPFGYKTGKQSYRELAKNPYIIARYGEEGADKIAEIASKYEYYPFVQVFDSVNEEIVKTSVISLAGLFDCGLYVGDNTWDDYTQGRAFGVKK